MKITGNESAIPFLTWNEAGYGNAFVIYDQNGSKQILQFEPGLTKREYFAAMAILKLAKGNTPSTAAKLAVEYADALIDEINKTDK
jgi:hypothetical protein